MRFVPALQGRARSDVLAEALDSFSRQQLALRGVILLAGVGALASMIAASDHVAAPLVVLTAAIAVMATRHPDTPIGLVFVLAIGAQWAATVDHHRSPWSLVAALCLLVFHAASACASTAPPGAQLQPDAWRRWRNRFGVVALVTAGAWSLILALTAGERRGNAALLGAVLLLIAALAWWFLIGGTTPGRSPGNGSGGADGGDDGVEQGDEVVG